MPVPIQIIRLRVQNSEKLGKVKVSTTSKWSEQRHTRSWLYTTPCIRKKTGGIQKHRCISCKYTCCLVRKSKHKRQWQFKVVLCLVDSLELGLLPYAISVPVAFLEDLQFEEGTRKRKILQLFAGLTEGTSNFSCLTRSTSLHLQCPKRVPHLRLKEQSATLLHSTIFL